MKSTRAEFPGRATKVRLALVALALTGCAGGDPAASATTARGDAGAASRGPSDPSSSSADPGASASTAPVLDAQGRPRGWQRRPTEPMRLVYVGVRPACPPCPTGSECEACPPPFYRFAASADAGAREVLIDFLVEPTTLELGTTYAFDATLVPWPPYGEVGITLGGMLQKVPPRGQCRELLARFVEVRGESTNRCAKDADCAMFTAGVDDCGRVGDVATTRRANPIGEELRALGCVSIQCGPRASHVACEAGQCVERSAR